jgi:hypothetical protein
MSEEAWWLSDHPDAEAHRAFLKEHITKEDARVGRPLPPRRRKPVSHAYVTMKDFNDFQEYAAKAIREVLHPLEERIKALEEAPAEFKGPWRETDAPYPQRSLVVRSGAFWFARVKTGAKPGDNRDWVLVAKARKECAEDG